jgi:RecJ-like exonuclease
MERIARLERGLTETNSAVRLIHQNLQTMTGQVQVVSSRVKGILSNLKATLGYRAKNTYVCASCHSKGKVAARVKCTHCGKENLWGWWPSKSHDDSTGDEDSVHWLWQRWR